MTKSELFDPNNLNKRVLEHFGRRTSVAKILRDIVNENIKNDYLVLEGLINHINLMSSSEKIETMQ